jgi:hypothetical protein
LLRSDPTLPVIESTRVASYSNVTTLSLKVTIVDGFTLKHPEFDPLGVVDHLESTRHQSLVGMYVAFRI